jgi:hypothetical protein
MQLDQYGRIVGRNNPKGMVRLQYKLQQAQQAIRSAKRELKYARAAVEDARGEEGAEEAIAELEALEALLA